MASRPNGRRPLHNIFNLDVDTTSVPRATQTAGKARTGAVAKVYTGRGPLSAEMPRAERPTRFRPTRSPQVQHRHTAVMNHGCAAALLSVRRQLLFTPDLHPRFAGRSLS
jgi:hypothetical protein